MCLEMDIGGCGYNVAEHQIKQLASNGRGRNDSGFTTVYGLNTILVCVELRISLVPGFCHKSDYAKSANSRF